MKFNLLKVGLSLLPLLSVVFADECTEVEKIGANIYNCTVDEEGNATELRFSIRSNSIEILKTLLDRLSFKKLEKLDLNRYGLDTLPDSIGRLKNLKELNIGFNSLTTLPDSIGDLENLEKLEIYYNALNTLPESIGRLKNLKYLDLDDNRIESLPDSISDLENLEYLDLYYNSLKTLPDINGLKNLKQLILNVNRLESLPSSISDLKNLENLNIYGNDLKVLPDNIGDLRNLKDFDLFGNNLEYLPDSICDLKNLENLSLSNNVLKTIPDCLNNLKNLEVLSLRRNNLTSLPDSISDFVNFKKLDLSENKLEIIPESIGELKNLEVLLLSENKLEIIPESIGELKNLEYLDISYNYLTSLPDSISDLINLEVLYLGSNENLTELPRGIVKLENLKTLSVTNTKIYAVPNNIIENLSRFYMDYVAVYFYNVNKNKCLRTTGLPESTLTYGACDNSDNTLWIISTLHKGIFRSKANPDYCLTREDGTVLLKECQENTDGIFYRDGNFIKLFSSDNQCIGSSSSENANSDDITLKDCDSSDPDQIWYFNNWNPFETPVNVVPLPPETVTIYFYNALKNECIRSDGSSVLSGSCDFTDNSLWEIPITHDGNYRLKADPEKCLSIVDGVVALSDCNESTTLYREGNFIKSPLSDNSCIATSDNSTLDYFEGCDANNSNAIWYFNIWTPPAATKENPTMTITTTVTAVVTEAF